MAVLEKVIHIAFSALFGSACIACGEGGALACARCLAHPRFSGNECLFCGIKTRGIGQCEPCQKTHPFEGVAWAWRYENERARAFIAAFKYRKRRAIGKLLAAEIIGALPRLPLPKDTVVIPIPLHEAKEKARGFNQSEILALHLGMPVLKNAARRVKETQPQAWAESRRERMRQMQGAFAVSSAKKIAGKNILIIDDVATTGATITELALTLKKAGAAKIYAVVLAHGQSTNLVAKLPSWLFSGK